VLATVTALAFRSFLPDPEAISADQQRNALATVIYLYTLACFLAAACVWLFVPESTTSGDELSEDRPLRTKTSIQDRVRFVLQNPAIWLIAVVIISAYCAYKAILLNSLYAETAYQWSEKDTPILNVVGSWLRPVAALGAGYLADRISPSRTSMICFAVLVAAYACFATTQPGSGTEWLLWATVLVSSTAAFALRAVYYAVLEETAVPRRVTGTAVGVISFVGYTPEIFFPPLVFAIIQATPGSAGYQHVFWLIAAASAVGFVATAAIRSKYRGQ
jgi:nitrate/nitrite transporter NarK